MNNDELKVRIGANIAQLRRAAGLTQADLAQRLNYSDKAISKWERGESMPDLLTVVTLAQVLETDANALMNVTDGEPEAPKPAAKPAKKQKNKHRTVDKGVIQKLSSILVWTVALFIYMVLDAFRVQHCWMIFVLAVIANAIVLLSLRAAWRMYGINRILISVIMWGALAFFYLSVWLTWHVRVWRVFLLGLLGQAAIILWFRIFKHQEE